MTEPFHIMVDCETLGVGPMPALLSIGAVRFDPRAHTVPAAGASSGADTFFAQIDPASCIALGGGVDTNTLKWWFHEPDSIDARRFVLGASIAPVHAVIGQFAHWARTRGGVENGRLWSHGVMADCRWLEAYVATMPGLAWPFNYRGHRDTRTLLDLADEKMQGQHTKVDPTIPHHPLHDAIAQAQTVQLAYRALGL